MTADDMTAGSERLDQWSDDIYGRIGRMELSRDDFTMAMWHVIAGFLKHNEHVSLIARAKNGTPISFRAAL